MASRDDEIRFDNRAIIVTGAGRGMGREHALLLASRGAAIVVADNGVSLGGDGADVLIAQAVVDEIAAAGGTAIAYDGDISTEEGARGVVAESLAAFDRVDAIIHNASISPTPVPIYKLDTARIEKMLHVNTFAAFWMSVAAWPHMISQGGGRIVLIASHAIYGAEMNIPYSAAKSSYIGFVRSLADEGGPANIHANVIAPTALTRMTDNFAPSPFRDWFYQNWKSEHVSPVAAFLCHESCSINAEMLSVAGGRIARITLAETLGDIGTNASIEEVRDRMDAIMGDDRFFYPGRTPQRAMDVAKMMGFVDDGSIANPYAIDR